MPSDEYEELLKVIQDTPLFKNFTLRCKSYEERSLAIPPLFYIDKKEIFNRESVYISLNQDGTYAIYAITESEGRKKFLKTEGLLPCIFEVRNVKTDKLYIAKTHEAFIREGGENDCGDVILAYEQFYSIQQELKKRGDYNPYVEIYACGRGEDTASDRGEPIMSIISIMARGVVDCENMYAQVQLTLENIKEIILQLLRYIITGARYKLDNYDRRAANFILVERDQHGFYDLKRCDLNEHCGDVCTSLTNGPSNLLGLFITNLQIIFGLQIDDESVSGFEKEFNEYEGIELNDFLRREDCDCYLMSSCPDKQIIQSFCRPSYIFTSDAMFYSDGKEITSITITSEKLGELKAKLNITDSGLDKGSKVLSFEQLAYITPYHTREVKPEELACWESKEFCDAVVAIVSKFSSLTTLSSEIANKFSKRQSPPLVEQAPVAADGAPAPSTTQSSEAPQLRSSAPALTFFAQSSSSSTLTTPTTPPQPPSPTT